MFILYLSLYGGIPVSGNSTRVLLSLYEQNLAGDIIFHGPGQVRLWLKPENCFREKKSTDLFDKIKRSSSYGADSASRLLLYETPTDEGLVSCQPTR